MRYLVCASLALFWTTATAAQEAHVVHYDIAIAPDFTTRRLKVVSEIILADAQRASSYTFVLNPRFDSVTVQVNHARAVFERSGRNLTVALGAAAARTTLQIAASGALGRSDDEERSVIGQHDLFLLWSDGWYPAARTDWAATRIAVTLPDSFKVIAPGVEVARTSSKGATRHVFESREPIGPISVFADTRWLRRDSVINGIPITLLLHPRSVRFADSLFRSSADVLAFFAELHGMAPARFGFITQDSMFARRAYSGFIGYEPNWLEAELARTGYDAHETSLLWWGGMTRGRGPGAWQWTEGLGDYVEVLYSEARGLPLPGNFARFREQYLSMSFADEPVITALNGSTPQKVVHGKYPWLMHVLRYRIGDDAFKRGIRLLFTRYRYRTFTLSELVQVFAEAAGKSLDWWQAEWLESAGVPDLLLSYAVSRAGSRVQLTGTIEQQEKIYHLPIELGLYTGSKIEVRRVDLAAAVTPISFELSAAPDSIRLDPHGWILARKRTVLRK